jgi:pimeloyl-ACP methyl ester carboxylesterase
MTNAGLPRVAVGLLLGCSVAIPPGSAAQTFSVRGESLRFVADGDGPPVVFVPGWTQSLETWDFVAPKLQAEFKVARYDRGLWGAQDDPRDLIALVEQLGVQRIILVGHSIGASTALRFAAAYPERVDKLVLVGPPSAPGVGPWNDEDTWEAHLRRLGVDPPNPFTIAARHGVDSLLVLARSHPLFRLPDESPAARRLLDGIWSRYDGADLQPPSGDPVTPPITEQSIRRLDVRTLVLIGDEELGHFRRSAERLVELLPRAELAVVPGGGHMIHLAQPDGVVDRVRAFLLR